MSMEGIGGELHTAMQEIADVEERTQHSRENAVRAAEYITVLFAKLEGYDFVPQAQNINSLLESVAGEQAQLKQDIADYAASVGLEVAPSTFVPQPERTIPKIPLGTVVPKRVRGEYEPGESRMIQEALGTDTNYGDAVGRLRDLFNNTRPAMLGDIRAALATASILSQESPEARADFGALVRFQNRGNSYVGVSYRRGYLTPPNTISPPPLDLLILSTDVLTHNDTSVFPHKERPQNAREIAEIAETTAALRENVEHHYRFKTNDEATVGFMAECLIRESILDHASPEVIAAQDKRIAAAWGRINPSNLSSSVINLYHSVLGIEPHNFNS
jgi:hypothetical protein